MGEAARRRRRQAQGHPENAAADAAIQAVFAEGGGAVAVELIFRSDLPDLMRRGLRDHDVRALRRLGAVASAMQLLRTARPLCLLCDHQPTAASLAAIVVMSGDVEGAGMAPTQGIINLLCTACVDRHRGRVLAAVQECYAANLSDVRAVSETNAAPERQQ